MDASGPTYDVIVLGAGIMGLSSALFCKKAGLRVLLLEQFNYPHTRGSSHGSSRIIRKAYLGSSELSKMMAEAFDLWDEIERATQTQLHLKIGMLYVEPNPAPTIKRIADVEDRLGYKYKLMDSEVLNARFGEVMSFPGYTGLFDLEGGLLRSDLCCSKTYEWYKNLGGDFVDMARVTSIKPGEPIEVVTQNGKRYFSRKLVVSAGPWSGELLKELGLELPLYPENVSVCYWKIKDSPTKFGITQFPCFKDISEGTYALPSFEYPGLIKLVNPYTNVPAAPETRDLDAPTVETLMRSYRPYVRQHFPKIETPPALIERCMYTKTPDYHWILDKHPKHNNIVILAGFGGHGFKGAPLVGKLAQELLSGDTSLERYNMDVFSIKRFSLSSDSHL